jgi:hypothetical protein
VTPTYPLALLPVTVLAGAVVAARPRAAVTGAWRLAGGRATLLVAGYAAGSVELLSALHALGTPGILCVWLVAAAVTLPAAALWWRGAGRLARLRGAPGTLRRAAAGGWRSLGWGARSAWLTLAALVLAELVLALASAPNTYDSQTYHLPRIEHWVAQGDVGPFAARIHRQVTYPPGAEYLLLHLRLLTGGDRLYPLTQWGCGLLCALLASRIAAQLGGGRRAQLLAAFVVGTAPLVVLESSSTQTDLVVASLVAAVATVALDGVRARLFSALDVLLLGVGTGLVALTKPTGLFAVGPLLVWWGLTTAARGRAGTRITGRGVLRLGWATAAVLGLAAVLAGPYLWRMNAAFGHPLGPGYLRQSVSMQRHDPAALLVNGVRMAHTLFDTPVGPARRISADGIVALSRALGIDPSDPAITFDRTTFPDVAWYPSEDKAAYPVQAALAVLGTVAALARVRRVSSPEGAGLVRGYAAVVVAAVVLYVALVKWQPWGNRLGLFAFVLAAPLAGLLLGPAPAGGAGSEVPERTDAPALGGRWWRPGIGRWWRPGIGRCVVPGVLVVCAVAGALSAAYGWPRRLVGADSVFLLDAQGSRFVTRPQWRADYAAAGAAVRASGARRIGLAESNDSWEYPWWLEFRGSHLVLLSSLIPDRPRADLGDVDAVVCTVSVEECRRYTADWPLRTVGSVSYAVRPVTGPGG